MRIGIITDNYLPAVGGTEISIVNYKRKLEELGHDVFVFCPSLGKKNPKRQPATTVRLPSIRCLYKEGPLLYVYPGLTKKIRKYKLDILHSQSPMAAPYVAAYLSKKLHIPHIHTMHTLLPEIVKLRRVSWGRQLLPYLAQSVVIRSLLPPKHYLLQDDKQILPLKVRLSWAYLLRMVTTPDTVIFPSQHVLDIFISRGFTNHARLLPTFSDMFAGANYQKPQHHAANQQVNIIHVGRLDPEKRPQVIIDAACMLPKSIDWHLTIVGGGSEQKNWHSALKNINSTIE